MIPPVIKKWVQQPIEGLVGKLEYWHQHQTTVRTRPTISKAIETIERRWGAQAGSDPESPIFIFSAGWRTGSTLLQRLVLSGGETLVWGEPYPHCDYIRMLANSLVSFRDELPPEQFFIKPADSGATAKIGSDQWVACLYPRPTSLYDAHRQYFRTLYGVPAFDRGYPRWGLKEVVLSCEYAEYLRWLFPQAKFLFLYRNPYHAYRSYRTFGDWYYRWPDQPVFTARKFGWVWRRLMESFLEGHERIGGMLIRYEDLVGGSISLRDLSRYLGTGLSKEVLEKRVTGRAPKALDPIPWVELMQLKATIGPLAARLGYKNG
jgi:hypothetical protein